VTNPKGWKRQSLASFGTITTGNTPSRAREDYYGDYLEWIKSDNINTPNAYLTCAEEYLSELGARTGRVVPAGSILVTCIAGSPDSIGNVAIADRTVAFNQQINALTPYDSGISFFLYTQFLLGKRLVQRASTNSMKGMVSKSAFSDVQFINPPIALQREFSSRAMRIQEMLEAQKKGFAELDNLFRSLQQRAFRGEL
jgi:type I restriction enzyme S subunit